MAIMPTMRAQCQRTPKWRHMSAIKMPSISRKAYLVIYTMRHRVDAHFFTAIYWLYNVKSFSHYCRAAFRCAPTLLCRAHYARHDISDIYLLPSDNTIDINIISPFQQTLRALFLADSFYGRHLLRHFCSFPARPRRPLYRLALLFSFSH